MLVRDGAASDSNAMGTADEGSSVADTVDGGVICTSDAFGFYGVCTAMDGGLAPCPLYTVTSGCVGGQVCCIPRCSIEGSVCVPAAMAGPHCGSSAGQDTCGAGWVCCGGGGGMDAGTAE